MPPATVLPLTNESVPVGTTIGPFVNTMVETPSITTCSAALNTAEALGDKASIACTCNATATEV